MQACKDWEIGKPWTLSMVADSVEREMDRKFGFAGGEGFNAPGLASSFRTTTIGTVSQATLEKSKSRFSW